MGGQCIAVWRCGGGEGRGLGAVAARGVGGGVGKPWFSYLGLEKAESSAAGGGVEGLTGILQTRSARRPLGLQGVPALLLRLLQLLRHLLSQLVGPLVPQREDVLFSASVRLSFVLRKVCRRSCLLLVNAVSEGLHEVLVLLLVPPHHLPHLLHAVQSSPHFLVHQFLPIQGQL